MADPKQSLLFIPDITGFTEFVSRTEIEHGQHIISELLEVILDANELSMEVAEIEGDAVLFYLSGEVPSVTALVDQAKKMFIDFHDHLKDYENKRICQCGACCGATNLSLKFIVHQGVIGFTNVKNQSKPYGSDLVLAHRLLKNNLSDREYILFTKDFFPALDQSNSQMEDWVTERGGKQEYEKFGEVCYRSISLEPLQRYVKIPPPYKPPIKEKRPFKARIFIEKPFTTVFEVVTELDHRLKWNDGVQKLEYKKDRVNRIGTKHRCVFNFGFADFETISDHRGKEKVAYGERIESLRALKALNIYYIMEARNGGTELEIEAHFIPLPLIGWLVTPFMRWQFTKQLAKTGSRIKKVAEEQF